MKLYPYYNRILTTQDLNGLTGDNGEEYVVFTRDNFNPIRSGWTWHHTLEDAGQEYAQRELELQTQDCYSLNR